MPDWTQIAVIASAIAVIFQVWILYKQHKLMEKQILLTRESYLTMRMASRIESFHKLMAFLDDHNYIKRCNELLHLKNNGLNYIGKEYDEIMSLTNMILRQKSPITDNPTIDLELYDQLLKPTVDNIVQTFGHEKFDIYTEWYCFESYVSNTERFKEYCKRKDKERKLEKK